MITRFLIWHTLRESNPRPLVRSQTLYPAELRVHTKLINKTKFIITRNVDFVKD